VGIKGLNFQLHVWFDIVSTALLGGV